MRRLGVVEERRLGLPLHVGLVERKWYKGTVYDILFVLGFENDGYGADTAVGGEDSKAAEDDICQDDFWGGDVVECSAGYYEVPESVDQKWNTDEGDREDTHLVIFSVGFVDDGGFCLLCQLALAFGNRVVLRLPMQELRSQHTAKEQRMQCLSSMLYLKFGGAYPDPGLQVCNARRN